ncbi:MAG TPA: spore coat protein, partial [Symbiobacteriaceae bacterium]|nr:spore coat protein [Symbiobacteriaceae bacterium]
LGVRNTAMAIAETASPEVRALLRQQLTQALAMHEEIYQLMMKKGWFYPYRMDQQFALDMKSADTVVKIANLDLFPEDTSRRGLFATPNK